jgi:hypothetical protein
MSCLATLSDNYANRIMMNEQAWLPVVNNVVKAMRTETQEVYIHYPDGVKKVISNHVTRQSEDIGTYFCKFFFNMACDENQREYVADNGTPLVMYTMKFCEESATVQHQAALALYNFIYRNQQAHYTANEDGCLELCEIALDNFRGDDTFRRAMSRTIAALQPDGWRGNLAMQFNEFDNEEEK